MAQDDMHVIMYRILAYLYWCMKQGIVPDPAQYRPGENLKIPRSYWNQIMLELIENDYVKGFVVTHTYSDVLISDEHPVVTLAGVQFLQENSMMRKAQRFLKEAKEAIPFI